MLSLLVHPEIGAHETQATIHPDQSEAKDDIELVMLLLLFPKRWDYSRLSGSGLYAELRMKCRAPSHTRQTLDHRPGLQHLLIFLKNCEMMFLTKPLYGNAWI